LLIELSIRSDNNEEEEKGQALLVWVASAVNKDSLIHGRVGGVVEVIGYSFKTGRDIHWMCL
jgi:hypothetical protein